MSLLFLLAQIGRAANTSEESISAKGTSEAQDGASAAALTQLRGLAGEWEGSFEWAGARTATGRISATLERIHPRRKLPTNTGSNCRVVDGH